ncbi:hypothetical protein QBC42DRAFT_109696 [Cladorrhinum samala]|uniref:DUF8004 domain-containing protein n=1 Tax=Cladorrhinum samala TaxID=585594 RepID=A0AAV9HJV9_9PEZI|nr:hypothetical protein QBC42DRAFT_109696 [Cladorrhinum samala]
MEQHTSIGHRIKRWDGAGKVCTHWDSLRRDPELWSRDGNCLIYLFERGQSRRSPAFKVNFNTLLAAKCHPLVAKYAVRDVPDWSTYDAEEAFLEDLCWDARPNDEVELYTPAPATANSKETGLHYLAIRNLLAWAFRKPVVGEHLGVTFISLLNSLREFRCPDEDNMDSILAYMDEQGYLDMANQPFHALAMLHFAERFRLKDLYTDALCHCVGMREQVNSIPEYQLITSASRNLIWQTRSEMDERLCKAGQMLRNFLEGDLPEAQMRLSPGERSHLRHFRTFLMAFFAKRLGRYPPASIDPPALVFEPDVYKTMHEDMNALYLHLADTDFTTRTLPTMAQLQTGSSILHIIHGFDQRNRYASLNHPLPLIPEIAPKKSSRRLSWLVRSDKLKPDQRLVAHAAMVKATNKEKAIMDNELVVAYRKFEEDALFFPPKAERSEKLSPADARKARWSLIYCTYQVIRSCAPPPAECAGAMGTDLKYNIAVDTANITLPWEQEQIPIPDSGASLESISDTSSSVLTASAVISLQSLANPPCYAKHSTLWDERRIPKATRSFSSRSPPSRATEPVFYTPPTVPLRIRSLQHAPRPSCHTFGSADKFSVESLKPPPLSVSVRSASSTTPSSTPPSSTSRTHISYSLSATPGSSSSSWSDEKEEQETDLATLLHPLPLRPAPPLVSRVRERQRGRKSQTKAKMQTGATKQSRYSMHSVRSVSSSVYSDGVGGVASLVGSVPVGPPPLPAPPLPKKSSKRGLAGRMGGMYPLPLRIRKVGAAYVHAQQQQRSTGGERGEKRGELYKTREEKR